MRKPLTTLIATSTLLLSGCGDTQETAGHTTTTTHTVTETPTTTPKDIEGKSIAACSDSVNDMPDNLGSVDWVGNPQFRTQDGVDTAMVDGNAYIETVAGFNMYEVSCMIDPDDASVVFSMAEPKYP